MQSLCQSPEIHLYAVAVLLSTDCWQYTMVEPPHHYTGYLQSISLPVFESIVYPFT